MCNELISVIIPVYNVEQYLPACIESIIGQTYSNLEIILVNDGSTDNSTDIIWQYAKVDSRIRVIEKDNGGLSSARNVGVQVATGKYIVFIDSDDYVRSDMLERMLSRMIESAADVVECGYYELFGNADFSRIVPYEKKYNEILETDKILNRHIKGEISLLVWNKLYKTERIRHVEFVVGKKYEDILWSAEILANTTKICSVRECLYYWRQRQGSITNTRPNIERLVAVEHYAKRINMLKPYLQAHLLARGRIICECYLECKALKSAGDTDLMKIAKQHSARFYNMYKLSLYEIACLGTAKEMIRYFFYLFKFFYIQVEMTICCNKKR